MWRYLLLGMPVFGLLLFFAWSFERALNVYLVVVLVSFGIYYIMAERVPPTQ